MRILGKIEDWRINRRLRLEIAKNKNLTPEQRDNLMPKAAKEAKKPENIPPKKPALEKLFP